MLTQELLTIITSAVVAKLVSHYSKNADKSQKENTISASGVAQRSLKTTIAQVNLGVRASGKTAVEVQEALGASSTTLLPYLRSRNVSKLQTTGISLNTTHGKEGEITGYLGRNTVRFEVPVEEAGSLLDGSVKNGASEITNIRFLAAPDAVAAARKDAVRDAVKNARNEAETAVAALGKALGRVKSMEIRDAFAPGESRQFSSPAGFSASLDIGAGHEQIVSATASVSFAILQGRQI